MENIDDKINNIIEKINIINKKENDVNIQKLLAKSINLLTFVKRYSKEQSVDIKSIEVAIEALNKKNPNLELFFTLFYNTYFLYKIKYYILNTLENEKK